MPNATPRAETVTLLRSELEVLAREVRTLHTVVEMYGGALLWRAGTDPEDRAHAERMMEAARLIHAKLEPLLRHGQPPAPGSAA